MAVGGERSCKLQLAFDLVENDSGLQRLMDRCGARQQLHQTFATCNWHRLAASDVYWHIFHSQSSLFVVLFFFFALFSANFHEKFVGEKRDPPAPYLYKSNNIIASHEDRLSDMVM